MDKQALMVLSVWKVSAISESSVDFLGCRENVGVMAKSGSWRSCEHHGMDLKCAWSGSSILERLAEQGLMLGETGELLFLNITSWLMVREGADCQEAETTRTSGNVSAKPLTHSSYRSHLYNQTGAL